VEQRFADAKNGYGTMIPHFFFGENMDHRTILYYYTILIIYRIYRVILNILHDTIRIDYLYLLVLENIVVSVQ